MVTHFPISVFAIRIELIPDTILVNAINFLSYFKIVLKAMIRKIEIEKYAENNKSTHTSRSNEKKVHVHFTVIS